MRARNGGFTLVEILIVVVILGILAAIVIPQFTQASTEARESSLVSNLQTIRSQIELYKIQHNDIPPAVDTFEAQMTKWTNLAGDVFDAPAAGLLGPYLQKVPNNPFTNGNAVTGGDWLYAIQNVTSYTFVADDGGTSPDGTAHNAW
ncbi:MAG: prepilin-type N-terminal cleavage/methylation domain-containing protein [Phycisphaerae bacterium]|nr:prepilin-type N-terminal cleavage/methylation domain-containing protein [Phycisphaerae bacterium]